MRDDDLIEWADTLDFQVPHGAIPGASLAECNRILDERERRSILEATWWARGGRHFEAEDARRVGGYDGVARREDRARRGLPDHL